MKSRPWSSCSIRLVWWVATCAHAPSALGADARELYRLGLESYDDRDYETALARFEESYVALPSPNSKLYVARCLRYVGRTREAIAAYEQAVRLARTRQTSEPKYQTTHENALRELAVLKPPPPPEQRFIAATWTAAGIGLVGLGSFAVFGNLARSRYRSLESNCTPLPCPASQANGVESGHDYQRIANISLAVGLSGVITSMTLYVLGRPRLLPYGQIALGGVASGGNQAGGVFADHLTHLALPMAEHLIQFSGQF